MEILIYRDDGAHPECLRALVTAFRIEKIDLPIAFASRSCLHQPDWKKKTALLIFPGGRDIPYHEALQGQANREIRNYVEKGGNYLGICAGAYFGCAQVEFEKGNALEVTGSRELAFFPGCARGPAYGLNQFRYETEAGARIAKVEMNSKVLSAYYNGGCSFEKADAMPLVKVIARFQDLPEQPAAIVACSVGKGCALLSGVHPEYSADFIPCIFKDQLHEVEEQRRMLFRELLGMLQIKQN